MNLNLLKDPFKEDEIEWRIGQCGKKGNGQIWAICLAYVQARAIMDRLDAVCGPENWRVDYSFVPGDQTTTSGVVARLSIFYGDRWITKEDGAEQTDIESFKGGLSSALKRAGSVWGIGRYLYRLDAAFANVNNSKSGNYGKTKDGVEFYWDPPRLPVWALPVGAPVGSNGIHPEQPGLDNGNISPTEYRMEFGKWPKKSLEEVYQDPKIGPKELEKYYDFIESLPNRTDKYKRPHAQYHLEFLERCADFLGTKENEMAEKMRAGA